MLSENQPIGLFDSGLGGLTVANAVKNHLPYEKIIYFGDTAHLPYGDKSSDSIKYYSIRITNFLIEQQCKTVIIACNTASAHAFRAVKQHINSIQPEISVINVIDPVVHAIIANPKWKKIGVIGTKGTINSNTYQQKLHNQNPDYKIISKATPLLVPMIEEAFIYDDISNAIIRSYLSDNQFNEIDALILGCTHYPIIKNQIRKFFNFKVSVIDSSQIIAGYLKEDLQNRKLLAAQTETIVNHIFYISDYTDSFKNIAEMFFEEEINLKKLDLWKNT